MKIEKQCSVCDAWITGWTWEELCENIECHAQGDCRQRAQFVKQRRKLEKRA